MRQTRKVVLTAEGRALYPTLRRALDAMAQAVEAVRRQPARRVATLSATVAFTAQLLVPRAAGFRTLHPGWDLRLHASDDPVDLHAGEADAAIRYGLGPYPGPRSGASADRQLRARVQPSCRRSCGRRTCWTLR